MHTNRNNRLLESELAAADAGARKEVCPVCGALVGESCEPSGASHSGRALLRLAKMRECSQRPGGRTGAALAAFLAVVALALPGVAQARAWPTWDNVGETGVADCMFAAAADWEIAALHHTASEAEIIQQFHEAGGTAQGIAPQRFIRFWRGHGVGGIRADMTEVAGARLHGRRLHRRVRALLTAHRYLLTASRWWGQSHEVLVIGASATSITLVTWGEERSMSWAEWEGESVEELAVVRHPQITLQH